MEVIKRFIGYILKAILLYGTAFLCILFVEGVESIYDKGMDTFLGMIVLIGILIFCCYKLISEKEFEVLSLYKWFNKIIKEESCEQ